MDLWHLLFEQRWKTWCKSAAKWKESKADCIRSRLRGELSNEWEVYECVCVCVCVRMNLLRPQKKGDLFLNTLFQFQKELQNKLPTRGGWGAANYKVELPGNWKDTSHEGRLYGEGERCELYLLMIGTRLTLEDSVLAAKRSTSWPTYAVMEKYRINKKLWVREVLFCLPRCPWLVEIWWVKALGKWGVRSEAFKAWKGKVFILPNHSKLGVNSTTDQYLQGTLSAPETKKYSNKLSSAGCKNVFCIILY